MSSRTGRRCVGREWMVAESNVTRRERISISIVGAVGGAETHPVSFRKYFKAAHGKKKFALKKKLYTEMNQLLSKITQTAYDIQFMKKPKERNPQQRGG